MRFNRETLPLAISVNTIWKAIQAICHGFHYHQMEPMIVYSHDFSQDYCIQGGNCFFLTLIPVKQFDLQIMTMPMITLVFLLMADK